MKLIAFDFVGTLTEEDTLCRRLHEISGCKKRAKANVRKFLNDRITEAELISTNVSYHAEAYVTRKMMEVESENVEFGEDVIALIEELKKKRL